MCGRYVTPDQRLIEKYYGLRVSPTYRGPDFNVAPTHAVPIVTKNGLIDMRFGLVPQWNPDRLIINAMAETIAQKRTFKGLLSSHRCLVPAQGFYEWEEVAGKKQPYYFHLKDRGLFSFAGIYTVHKSPDDYESHSFAIITTEPNALVKQYHNRMPVILNQASEDAWLASEFSDDLLDLLAPYPAKEMDAYQVSTRVNSTRNNDLSLLDPAQSS